MFTYETDFHAHSSIAQCSIFFSEFPVLVESNPVDYPIKLVIIPLKSSMQQLVRDSKPLNSVVYVLWHCDTGLHVRTGLVCFWRPLAEAALLNHSLLQQQRLHQDV